MAIESDPFSTPTRTKRVGEEPLAPRRLKYSRTDMENLDRGQNYPIEPAIQAIISTFPSELQRLPRFRARNLAAEFDQVDQIRPAWGSGNCRPNFVSHEEPPVEPGAAALLAT